MDPLIIPIAAYVAHVILKHHIKETWVNSILPCLFPKDTYQARLEKLLLETIVEFRKNYPKKPEETRIQFFEDKDIMAKLSMFVLFKEGKMNILVSDFESKDQIIRPSQEEIELFYQFFVEKAQSDDKLNKLHISEQYQEEIFRISQSLEKLAVAVKQIKNETADIKTDTSKLLEQSQVIQEGIKAISERFGTSVEVTYQLALAKTEIHPLAEHVTKRIATVNQLKDSFESKPWLAIVGSISTGKTQLSVLIAECEDIQKYWIGLRQFNSNNYILKIIYGLAASLNIQPKPSIEQQLEEIDNSLSKGDLIILDDIPKLNGRTKSDELFVAFIKKCIKKGVKILSTSNYEIPANINQLLPENQVEQINIPFFTEQEIKEVLIAYGADNENTESIKKFVKVISSGHPTIVTAIGRYLSAKGWKFTNDELTELFNGDYSTELNDETYENILQTIDDEDARELLYRLNLITGNFSTEEITYVSNVNPAIKLPLEKFHSLTGLWVQKAASDNYELSPLLKRLKPENLSFELRKRINVTLGKAVLDKKRLNPLEAKKAITYFINGEAYNDAGFVLTIVLNESLKEPGLFFDWNFDLFWYKNKLPKEMDIFLQMYIRTLQLTLNYQRGEGQTYLKDDLAKIVEIASRKGINTGPAALLLSSLYATENSSLATRYFILGARNYNELKKMAPFEKELSKEFDPEVIVWGSALGIKKKSEIENWLAVFEQLTSEQRQKALNSEMVDLASMAIGKNLIVEEEKKNPNEQDWNYILNSLEYLQNKALELGLDLMTANAMRYRINILSEKLGTIDKAQGLVNELMSKLPQAPTAQFLVKDAIGRQLFYHGKKEEAMSLIADAVAIEVDDFYTEKLDSYLVISQLLGEEDQKSAHYYSEKALEFVNNSEFFTETLKAKVFGEYAISLALNDKVKDAIYSLETAYQILLDSYDDSAENKHLVLWIGHIANYWHHILNIGKTPEKDMAGGPYLAPHRGMLLKTYVQEKIESIYFEERRFMVSNIFFNCFEQLGDFKLSHKWAYINLTVHSNLNSNAFSPLIYSLIPYFITDGKYNDAIDWQVKIIDATNEMKANPETIKSYNESEFLKNLIKDRPKNKIDEVDETILECVIIPMILHGITSFVRVSEKKNEIVSQFIEVLEKWSYQFSNRESINKIIELLKIFQEGSESKKIFQNISEHGGDLPTPVNVIGYLIASINAPSIEALKLHFALIKRLDTITKQFSIGSHKFILLPFFEKFWFHRHNERLCDFSDKEFWENKSLPFYEEAKWNEKLKRLFKILSHHLNYDPSVSESEWLDS